MVISVLVFFSGDLSSNPAEVYSFYTVELGMATGETIP